MALKTVRSQIITADSLGIESALEKRLSRRAQIAAVEKDGDNFH
jgi:hypothetical protein